MLEKYEYNSFMNPAFSGFIIAQFLKEFTKKNLTGIEPVYILFILPLTIHPEFRHLLNTTRAKNFILIIEKNRNLFSSFDKILKFYLPYTYEGLHFLLKSNVITIDNDKIIFNQRSFKSNNYSKHIKNEVSVAKKLSTLLANKFDVITILKVLEVEI